MATDHASPPPPWHARHDSALNQPLFRISWTRALAALGRYKWLALAILLTGTGFGALATRMTAPEYDVHSTVWISNETGEPDRELGPIRASEVFREPSWPELMTSFAILDKVVRTMSLNVQPARPADSTVFAGFDTDEPFRRGKYELKVDESGWQYKLIDERGRAVQTGIIGDSIGRKLGFRWRPSPAALNRNRNIEFSVATPREAAMRLRDNIRVSFPPGSNLLRVTLRGSNPQRITATMQALLNEFIGAAANLKKRSITEAAKALAAQLDDAGKQLKEAEDALETFRVLTITLPTEDAVRGSGSTAERVRDPVFENFFATRIEAENIRRDRQALESTLAAIRRGELDASALWAVPAVQTSASPELKTALADVAAKQAALRAAERTYTDAHKVVRDLKSDVDELQTQTIPRLVSALIDEQKRREKTLSSQVEGTAHELRAIPTRTTEETRLRREVEARGALYSTLKNKYEEARLAEASTVPDVSILDAPAIPQSPSRNRTPFMMLMAVLLSLAAAVAAALLLDQVDRRFRYPDQATQEMGLEILGVVPALQQPAPDLRDPVEAAHARESFRSIRLAVMNAFHDAGRAILTISSPGAGDGKSLLALNLSLAFADANWRTLLIDGDIRRGELHAKFGVDRLPGFVDYLAGGHTLEGVLRKTRYDCLTLLPRGASQVHGPELLLSPTMADLMPELERRYDVIIIDSPPLSAGIDPFVLGSATANMLLVLRSGATDRHMAQAKLKVLSRLPVRLLGAVLNATHAEGDYRYYSYLYSDLPEDGTMPQPPRPPVALVDTDVPPPPLQTS